MPKKINKILDELSLIFEKKNLKPKDKISNLEQFDSIIILQIMNLAKTKHKKNISGTEIYKCRTISEIINIIS